MYNIERLFLFNIILRLDSYSLLYNCYNKRTFFLSDEQNSIHFANLTLIIEINHFCRRNAKF